MSRTATTSADYLQGALASLAPPFTPGGWRKPTAVGPDGQWISYNAGTIDSNSYSVMIQGGATGTVLEAVTWGTGGASNSALSAGSPSNGSWQLGIGVFAASNNRSVKLSGATKVTDTHQQAISGQTQININGIANRSIPGEIAQQFLFLRALNDLEMAYLESGGNPLVIGADHYWVVDSSSGTETDVGLASSGVNLTVHGTSAGSTEPPVAMVWIGAAFATQSWTQGSVITSLDFTTKFLRAHAASTLTLMVLAAGSLATTANGGGAASNEMLVNDASGIAVGSYISDGPGGTKVPVYFKSGNTLILGANLTWSDTDSIYVYAATAKTFSGLTITANVLGGTPTGPDVGSNTLYPRMTVNSGGAFTDGPPIVYTVASSGAAPSFSAGPSVSAFNVDGFTLAGTSTQTATMYAVALLPGSAVPTSALVKAGSPTGFIQRFSVAVTAATPATLAMVITNLTSSIVLPEYDLHTVLDAGTGTSAVTSFLAQIKAPPAGKQYFVIALTSIQAITKGAVTTIQANGHGRTTGDEGQVFGASGITELNTAMLNLSLPCTVVDANHVTIPLDSSLMSNYTSGGFLSWGISLFQGSSPLPATGDVGVIDLVADNGAGITPLPNGAVTLSIATDSARQKFVLDFQDISGGVMAGAGTIYFHDLAPTPKSQDTVVSIVLPANQTIADTVLDGYFVNPQPERLTITVTGLSGLVSGLSRVDTGSATVLRGTTGASGSTAIQMTGVDAAGKSTVVSANILTGGPSTPNLQGLTIPVIDAQLAAFNVTARYGNQDDSNPSGPRPAGTAIFQNPAFGDPLIPGVTVVNITLSTGRAPIFQVATPTLNAAPIDQASAVAAIIAAGLVPQVQGNGWSGSVLIAQRPLPGELVPSGTSVYLAPFAARGGNTPPRRPHKPKPVQRAQPLRQIKLKPQKPKKR